MPWRPTVVTASPRRAATEATSPTATAQRSSPSTGDARQQCGAHDRRLGLLFIGDRQQLDRGRSGLHRLATTVIART
jgi:hypothetical protein